MRKILSIIFAVLFVAYIVGAAYAVSPLGETGDILGQGKYASDAHKIFRLVRYVPATYSGATALAADSIVIWDLTSDDGVTVTTTTTSSDSAVAGIIVSAVATGDTGKTAVQAVGDANWTWLQTYGKSQVNFVATTGGIAAGAAFGTSTTAGEAAAFVSSTTNASVQGKAGFAYDTATAGTDDVEVFILGLD